MRQYIRGSVAKKCYLRMNHVCFLTLDCRLASAQTSSVTAVRDHPLGNKSATLQINLRMRNKTRLGLAKVRPICGFVRHPQPKKPADNPTRQAGSTGYLQAPVGFHGRTRRPPETIFPKLRYTGNNCGTLSRIRTKSRFKAVGTQARCLRYRPRFE